MFRVQDDDNDDDGDDGKGDDGDVVVVVTKDKTLTPGKQHTAFESMSTLHA